MDVIAREFEPDTELAQSVDAFWFHATARPSLRPEPSIVYPDGCIDLIFRAKRDAGRIVHAQLFVAGGSARAHPVSTSDGESFAGVRFRPGMSRVCIDADPLDIFGRRVRASEIDSVFASLESRLSETRTPEESLSVLRRAVARSVRGAKARVAPARVRGAIDLLSAHDCERDLDTVAGAIGTSVRSMRRDVLEWTGLSPRLLKRIMRFQKALALVRSGSRASLTTIAHEAGYADHPHMTREFETFANTTPSAIRLADTSGVLADSFKPASR